jgi:hypothetical protein
MLVESPIPIDIIFYWIFYTFCWSIDFVRQLLGSGHRVEWVLDLEEEGYSQHDQSAFGLLLLMAWKLGFL